MKESLKKAQETYDGKCVHVRLKITEAEQAQGWVQRLDALAKEYGSRKAAIMEGLKSLEGKQ